MSSEVPSAPVVRQGRTVEGTQERLRPYFSSNSVLPAQLAGLPG